MKLRHESSCWNSRTNRTQAQRSCVQLRPHRGSGCDGRSDAASRFDSRCRRREDSLALRARGAPSLGTSEDGGKSDDRASQLVDRSASRSMSLGGWQQVPSPRYIGESMVAGSANCAPGSRANSASLAVSVCQCHLGRTAPRTHSSEGTHTRAHMHGCTQESKGKRCAPHTCSMRTYAWHEHTYTHARTHAFTAGR